MYSSVSDQRKYIQRRSLNNAYICPPSLEIQNLPAHRLQNKNTPSDGSKASCEEQAFNTNLFCFSTQLFSFLYLTTWGQISPKTWRKIVCGCDCWVVLENSLLLIWLSQSSFEVQFFPVIIQNEFNYMCISGKKKGKEKNWMCVNSNVLFSVPESIKCSFYLLLKNETWTKKDEPCN